MGDMAYSRNPQYAGLLVQLYRRIISMLRRTPNYQKLLYSEDEDFSPRRSRFAFRSKRRVKISKLGAKPGGRPSSASSSGSGAVGGGRPPKSRGFRIRIRRKNVTLPLVSALRRVRDAYVNLMLRLASSSTVSHLGGMYGGGSALSFPQVDKIDRDLTQGLQYLAQSRPASLTRLHTISETSPYMSFSGREIR